MTTTPTTETTSRIWYCRTCRCVVQAQPAMDRTCKCETPVMPLHPTLVTEMHTPKQRPMHAISDEEARLRALARKGTRVRVTVTYEGEISDAWQWSAAGRRGVEFVVDTPDGRRHGVDPQRAGVHIEAVDRTDDDTP